MPERASFEETLAFANKVRAAGGGAALDALVPAIPQDTNACLIAKNLNFSCDVDADGPNGAWTMWFEDEALRDKIARKLNLETVDNGSEFGMVLPPEIGQVAKDFDDAADLFTKAKFLSKHCGNDFDSITDEEKQLVEDMLPYIEAAEEEAKELGLVVDGKLVF